MVVDFRIRVFILWGLGGFTSLGFQAWGKAGKRVEGSRDSLPYGVLRLMVGSWLEMVGGL